MKYAIALGALMLSAGVASAADLPMAVDGNPVPPAAATPFDWTGFYVGAHAGYGAGHEDDNQSHNFPAGFVPPTDTTPTHSRPADHFNLNGFIGGVHAGYNYEMNPYVFGIEGDLDLTGIEGNKDGSYYGGVWLRHLKFESPVQGSLRLRAGVTPTDRLLLYATGGLAIAEGRLINSGTNYSIPIPKTSSTNTVLGWTAGIGAEYAFTSHWIGRVELRYSDFGSATYGTYDGPVKVDWNQAEGLIGISYKF